MEYTDALAVGDAELTGYQLADGDNPPSLTPDAAPRWVSSRSVRDDVDTATGRSVRAVKLSADQVVKKGNDFVLADDDFAGFVPREREDFFEPFDVHALEGGLSVLG